MAGGFIQPDKHTLNSLGAITPTFQNGHFKQYSLNVGRYTAATTTGSMFDAEFICNGVNNALGTTSRRAGKGWVSRRYAGNHSRYVVWQGPSFFFGSTSAFANGKVGVCIESSTSSQMVFQLHNPGSNPPAASNFLVNVYGGDFNLSQTTNAPTTNYTSNPY